MTNRQAAEMLAEELKGLTGQIPPEGDPEYHEAMRLAIAALRNPMLDHKKAVMILLFVTCFFVFWCGRISGKHAADRWWQKNTVAAILEYWPANDIAVHPPYSRATMDDLLCGKIGIYVYDHCESESFYRGKDLPCYDKKGGLIQKCSHHTDAPIFPVKAPELAVQVKRAKEVKARPNKFSLGGQSGGFRSDNLTVTYYSKISCAEMKIPCHIALDIANAKPGDYGWFSSNGVDGTCLLIGINGVLSRIDDASCHAQDWAVAGGKAKIEIKNPGCIDFTPYWNPDKQVCQNTPYCPKEGCFPTAATVKIKKPQ